MILIHLGGFFFFSSRRRHTISDRDWSSDVCSSDLARPSTGNPISRDRLSPVRASSTNLHSGVSLFGSVHCRGCPQPSNRGETSGVAECAGDYWLPQTRRQEVRLETLRIWKSGDRLDHVE